MPPRTNTIIALCSDNIPSLNIFKGDLGSYFEVKSLRTSTATNRLGMTTIFIVGLSVYVLFYFDALVYLQGLRRYSPKTLDQVLRTTVKTPKIRPKIRPIL
jgi:hypothetical protein